MNKWSSPVAKCADITVPTEVGVLIGIPTKKTATADSTVVGMSIIITRMKDRGAYRINNMSMNSSIGVSDHT